MTTHRYVGTDGQMHARITCERAECFTWDGSPIPHGHCTTCGGRTHEVVLTYSFGEAIRGCSSCASSLNFTKEA